MDLDRTLAERLAAWARTRRGWDTAGSLAALARCKGRNGDDVAMAWVRFCADDHARTPGAFPNLAGPHWTEKVAPPTSPRPPKPHEACRDCGRHHDACACEGGPTIRVVPPTADTGAAVKRLRAVVDEATADHCSHHVPRTACTEHRPTRNEGDPA